MAASLILIPPWQMADEQAHVAVVEVWRSRFTASPATDPGRQAEIIASMVDYDWWRHYGMVAPTAPLPDRFGRAPATATVGVDPTSPGYPTLFYGAVGAALSLAPPMSVVADLYFMRILSAVLGVLTLGVAWLGTNDAVGQPKAMAIGGLLAVHPQFVIASTSAGPDAFINLAGACMWWQVVRALQRPNFIWPLVAVWIAAVSAALADRMGVALIGIAFAASFAILLRRRGFRAFDMALMAVAAAIVVVLVRVDQALRAGLLNAFGVRLLPVDNALSWDFFVSFHSVLFRSWWFSLGWARYLPPPWWVVCALIVSIFAASGLVRWVVGKRDGPEAIRMAVVFLAVQSAALYWVFFRNGVGPQGRHLFPVLIPSLVLFCVGWDHCVPPSWRPRARIGLVLAVALLDTAGWLFLALPVYGRG